MVKKLLFICFLGGLFFSDISEAKVSYPFSGTVNFQTQELSVDFILPQGRPVAVDFKKQNDNQFQISFNIRHFQVMFFDVSTILESVLQYAWDEKSQKGYFKGKVVSQYTLINYKPSNELYSSFEVKDNKLSLDSSIQENISCRGTIDLMSPHNVDLVLRLSGVDINDFLNFFVEPGKISAGGEVDGDIRITGKLRELDMDANLVSYDGFVHDLAFRSFLLKAKGIYPHVDVSKSMITKDDGVIFTLAGSINLKDRDTFAKQIKALITQPVIQEDDKNLSWILKRISSEESPATVELKYLRHKNESSDPNSEKESGMLGLEQRMEF